MKFFVFASALLAVAVAKPSVLTLGPALLAAAPVTPILNQYHAQDTLGQYAYGYSGGPSAKAETKTFDGITRGTYSYVDPDGKLQTVEYTADALNGFRAAATNLPKAPIDDRVAPEPVEDTPEVAQARADHLTAFNEAKNRAEAAPEETAVPAEEVIVKNIEVSEDNTPAAPTLTVNAAPAIIAPVAPQLTSFVSLKTANLPAISYSLNAAPLAYSAPIYTTGALQYAYGGPIVARAAPFTAIHATQLFADTHEAAVARGDHLVAVNDALQQIDDANQRVVDHNQRILDAQN